MTDFIRIEGIVRAIQHEGGPSGWLKIRNLIGNKMVPSFVSPNVSDVHIETSNGLLCLKVSDWLVIDDDGDILICPDNIFRKMYVEKN